MTFSSLEEEAQDFSAHILLKGGEYLEFPAPINVADSDPTWKKILAELERGADVRVELEEQAVRLDDELEQLLGAPASISLRIF